MTLHKNKYRVETTRLSAWDYSAAGYYFVTVCTFDRSCLFGDIGNGEMTLSPQGLIVAEEWQNTSELRENVYLDEWIVMPNHFHGIVILQNGPCRDADRDAFNQNRDACKIKTHAMRLYEKPTTKRKLENNGREYSPSP